MKWDAIKKNSWIIDLNNYTLQLCCGCVCRRNFWLYIGIDVSKDKHDICIKSNDGNVLKRFQIKNTNKDLNKLYTTVDKLKSNAGENTNVLFGIKATGVYCFPL